MHNIRFALLLSFSLLSIGCGGPNVDQNSDLEVQPKERQQATSEHHERSSSPSIHKLDVPNLVVGVEPSERQLDRCKQAIAEARKLKNLDDETDTRIQKCKDAIVRVAVVDAEIAGHKVAIENAKQEQAVLLEQLDNTNAQIEVQACRLEPEEKQASCVLAAEAKRSQIQACRTKPEDQQAQCLHAADAAAFPQVGAIEQ